MNGIAFLKIIKGVQKVPGDTLSAEQGLDEIDLLDQNGFACDEYDMKIPALKSSAVYADSPLSDGRTLVSGVLGNVTETIRLQLTAGTIIQMAAMLSKLLRFKQDCNDFWDTFGQIEPVYIKHQVIGEPGPRYALLYDIDIDPGQQSLIPSEAKRTVTLSIERELGWRGIAPGANPKQWTAFKRNETFNATYADLTSAGVHLASNTALLNGNEYQTRDTFLNKNVLTIPASSIDGDLPALALISLTVTPGIVGFFLSRDTRPLTTPSTDLGNSQLRRLDLIAAAASLGTNATFVADTTGLAYVPTSATRRRIDVSFASAADTDRATWAWTDLNVMRGRFAMFVRARQYSGAQNDLRYYVKLSVDTTDYFYTSPTIIPTLQGTVAAGGFALDYLGVVDLPPRGKTVSQARGKGLLVSDGIAPSTNNLLGARLFASRVSGTTAILAFCDIILMPIDEVACKVVTVASTNPLFIDNTGHFTHGNPDDFAEKRKISSSEDIAGNAELSGNTITLLPGVDNHLIILADTGATGSTPTDDIDVYVDIVPRWQYLRDV